MKKVLGAIVAIVIIVIVIILVASGRSSAPKTTITTTPTPTSAASPAATSTPGASNSPAAASSVTITNFAFSPANITVTKGTTVTWTNKDAVAHTVTESDGKTGPNSGDLNQNQTYSFTFTQVGTFKYHCSIHPNMTGTVTVTE